MTAVATAACVFAAVWMLSLPPPAALRLTNVFRTPQAASRPATSALIARLRSAVGALRGRRRDVAKRRAAVIELCDGIAVELAAGRPAATALAEAARVLPAMPGVAAVIDAAQNADDVPAALTRASRTEGCEGLRLLAGCWRIGMDRGSMLASVIEGLAEALRDEQSHREEIALQLAGPRATARLLAGLPVLGLGMAAALGAKPLTFLFTTLPGALCLSAGTTLDAVGLWWTARLAASAEHAK